jgi:2,4'-dihydroxyacetophenone dioxygenase
MRTQHGMPDLTEILLHCDEIEWRPKSLKGVHEKMLWRDEATGASIALIKFEKGIGIPQPHSHASNQFMYCLSGKYEYTSTGVTLLPGSFYCNPKGNVHDPQKPDWYTDERDAH